MKKFKFLFFAILILIVSLACSLLVPSTSAGSTSGKGVSGLTPKSSGVIDRVTMAKGTQGDGLDPVNPTTVFATTDTFHAVVHVVNAQQDTDIKAMWYVVSTSAESNKLIDTSNFTATGSGNVDFTLAPNSAWPVGSYQVECYVNNALDQVINFSVK